MEFDLASFTPLIVQYATKLAGAVVFLLLAWIAAGWSRRIVRRALERASFDSTLTLFFANVARWLVLLLALLACLGIFGIQTTSFAAVIGAAGLAIGLAFQGALSNVASGVMLLIFRPFKIGDYVEAGGTAGTVQEIGIFSTTLHSPDNVRITVPNSAVYGSIVKNYSYNETRRNDMVFGISYDDDIRKAKKILEEIIAADERVLNEPVPVIALGELADSSVNFLVRPWAKSEDYWKLLWDTTETVKLKFDEAGISIPYPQMDVHLGKSDQ